MIPRIVFSELTKRWFVVTRYREKRGIGLDGQPLHYLVASIKHDVTDQMKAILKHAKSPNLAPNPKE